MDVNQAAPVQGTSLAHALRAPHYVTRNWLVFLSFLAFVVARYIQLGARKDFLATLRFELILGLALIVIVGFEMNQRKPEIGRARSILVTIGLLFVAMIIQLPLAADPEMANKIFMDRVIKFAFLTCFMVVMIESPRYLKLFLAAFLFSVFYITLESTEGLVSGALVWQNQGINRLHGAVPIYEHPNSLGGVAMGSLPFVAFLFSRVKSWLVRLGLLALTGTSLICVVYSGSRTVYVGLLAFGLWWLFQSEKKGKFLLYGAVAGAIGLSMLPQEYIERFKSIGGHEKEGQSKATRIVILKDAWIILQENPLGVGVASFPAVRLERFNRKQDTHNLYLEVATNLGWQGLAVFLALVWVMMLEFRRTMFGFRAQIQQLVRAGKVSGLPPPLRRRIVAHVEDLRFMIASAQAAGGFIFVRLVLGLFGMDLYEVYWWFGAGLALVLSGLLVTSTRNTRIFLLAMQDQGLRKIGHEGLG